MRISDWSSDVCSSDLAEDVDRLDGEWPRRACHAHPAGHARALHDHGPILFPLGRAGDRDPIDILEELTDPVEYHRAGELGGEAGAMGVAHSMVCGALRSEARR